MSFSLLHSAAGTATSTFDSIPSGRRHFYPDFSLRRLPKLNRHCSTIVKASVISPEETFTRKPLPSLSSSSPVLKLVSSNSLQYESGFLGAVPDSSSLDSEAVSTVAMEYLTNILLSKVYDVAVESPLQLAEKLSDRLGTNFWLKREDLQPVSYNFSFFFCFLFCLPFDCSRTVYDYRRLSVL